MRSLGFGLLAACALILTNANCSEAQSSKSSFITLTTGTADMTEPGNAGGRATYQEITVSLLGHSLTFTTLTFQAQGLEVPNKATLEFVIDRFVSASPFERQVVGTGKAIKGYGAFAAAAIAVGPTTKYSILEGDGVEILHQGGDVAAGKFETLDTHQIP